MNHYVPKKYRFVKAPFLGIWLVGGVGSFDLGSTILVLLRFIKPVASGGFGGLVYAGKVNEFEDRQRKSYLGGQVLYRAQRGWFSGDVAALPAPGLRGSLFRG